jgi:predicted nucleic acid-binding protein
MFLLDTCISLEMLLSQERADEAERLLRRIEPRRGFMSQFTLYSLGITLFRFQRYEAFLRLIEDVCRSGFGLVKLEVEDLPIAVEAARAFRLGFDDAYQYVAAEKHGLVLVSLDAEFDCAPRGRRTPAQVLLALAAGGS